MSRCKSVISTLADGATLKGELRLHAEACRECLDTIHLTEKVRGAVSAIEIPRGLEERVAPTSRRRRQSRLRQRTLLAAAAAAISATALLLLLRGAPPEEQVAPAMAPPLVPTAVAPTDSAVAPQGSEVSINTEPVGGRVFVDNKEVGHAPVKITLKKGSYNVTVKWGDRRETSLVTLEVDGERAYRLDIQEPASDPSVRDGILDEFTGGGWD
jgi:hypothetical protein